jgi:hypothetical protein
MNGWLMSGSAQLRLNVVLWVGPSTTGGKVMAPRVRWRLIANVGSLALLTEVLVCIANLPQSRLYGLLPWEWIRLRKALFVQEAA